MNDTSTSSIYEIKKSPKLKLIIIPIIIILIILLIIFLVNRSNPKSTVLSFIDALQDYNYDKAASFIDFDRMVVLKATSNDFYNMNDNLNTMPNISSDEKGNFIEDVSYTKRYINSIIDRFQSNNIILVVENVEVSKLDTKDDISKVVVNINIQENNTSTSDTFTFYTLKEKNEYKIISIDSNIYF